MTVRRQMFVMYIVFGSAILQSAPALAQATSQWEIDVHVGGVTTSTPGGGNATLPPPGAAFLTFVNTSSRFVPSWYFGDGAELLNDVAAAVGASGRITPLDPLLTTAVAKRAGGAEFGVRLGRVVRPGINVEFALDLRTGGLRTTDSTKAALEATRASFPVAIVDLLDSPPFLSATATSTSSVEASKSRQVLAMGATTVDVWKRNRLSVFAAGGFGLLANTGSGPSLTLSGHYEQSFLGRVSHTGNDVIVVRMSTARRQPVGSLGGGFRYAMNARSGLRMDVRVNLSSNGLKTTVSAAPETLPTASSSVFASLSSPSVQFGTPTASTASWRPSSLSAPGLDNFETFSGTGIDHSTSVTAGWFFSF